jgi:hypothetical protein
MATKKEWKRRAKAAEAKAAGLQKWADELQRRVDYLMPKPLPYGTTYYPDPNRPSWMGPAVEPEPSAAADLWNAIKDKMPKEGEQVEKYEDPSSVRNQMKQKQKGYIGSCSAS